MNYNKAQEQAIYTNNPITIVSAGAGTGKTMVLTERYIHLLEESKAENPIERILAITFTIKATKEMKERITNRLLDSQDPRLESLALQINEANIQTIDAFCSDLVREYAIDLGIDPKFEIIGEVEGSRLLKQTVHTVLLESLDNHREYIELVKDLELNFSSLEQNFLNLYKDLIQSSVDLENLTQGEMVSSEKIVSKIIDTLNIVYRDQINRSNKLMKALKSSEGEALLKGALSEDKALNFIRALEKPINRMQSNKEEKKLLKAGIWKLQQLKEIENQAYYDFIREIVREIHRHYQEEKNKLGYLDFSDLLSLSLKLTAKEEILQEISSRFDHILIDEFQDTNKPQIELFKRLTQGETSLFIVGDEKQSIYGFRGSNRKASIQAEKEMTNVGGLRILMTDNYRSHPELIKSINCYFNKAMDNYQGLKGHGKGKSPGIYKLKVGEGNREQTSEQEAEALIHLLKYLSKDYPYEEIAILLRTRTYVKNYEMALRQAGIPFINRQSKGFYTAREILDIRLALQVLASPKDYLNLVGYLRSPFVGLKDDSIYRLSYGLDLEDEKEKNKYFRACQLIETLRPYCFQNNIYPLLVELLEYTDFITYLQGTSRAAQATENILKLLEIAKEYDEEYAGGVYGFLAYMDDMEVLDNEQEATLYNNMGAVEISTIHGAKGLEYPIVILVDALGEGRGNYGKFNYSETYGLGVNREGYNYNFKSNKTLEKKAEESESLRLFYVALTRAKERVYLMDNEKKDKGFGPYIELLEGIEIDLEDLALDEEQEIETKPTPVELIEPIDYQVDGVKETITASQVISEEFQEIPFVPLEQEERLKLGSVMGNLVHSYAESNSGDKEELISELIETAPVSLNKAEEVRFRRLVNNYEATKTGEILVKEFPFYIELEEFSLKGMIDQIRQEEGKLILVDLKTNRTGATSKNLRDYTLQLNIYNLALEEQGIYIDELQLIYLETCEKLTVEKMSRESILKKVLEYRET